MARSASAGCGPVAQGEKGEDLLPPKRYVGGPARATNRPVVPRMINGVLGTKMQIITGYPGGNDINLAMERGEVDGRCGWSWSSVVSTRAHWLKDKKVNIPDAVPPGRSIPNLPDVPLITELAKTDEQRALLRLIFARQALGLAVPGAARRAGRIGWRHCGRRSWTP